MLDLRPLVKFDIVFASPNMKHCGDLLAIDRKSPIASLLA